jgi:hypothetical protein
MKVRHDETEELFSENDILRDCFDKMIVLEKEVDFLPIFFEKVHNMMQEYSKALEEQTRTAIGQKIIGMKDLLNIQIMDYWITYLNEEKWKKYYNDSDDRNNNNEK